MASVILFSRSLYHFVQFRMFSDKVLKSTRSMSDSEEVIPEKKGRGRPPAEKVDKVVRDFRFNEYLMLTFFPIPTEA